MVSAKNLDYAKLGGIGFVVLFSLIYLINTFSPNIAISLGPLIFIILTGIALYIGFRILKRSASLDLGTAVVFGIVLFGIFWVLNKYPSIAPTFSTVAKNTMSLVGIG